MRGKLRREKRFLFYAVVRGLRFLATVLPGRIGREIFAILGDAVRWIDRPAVRRALNHLDIALGRQVGRGERVAVMRRSFRETGRNVYDLLRATRHGAGAAAAIVEFDGLEHLDAALARGRGVIALSGHLGNWELMGAALAARGYPVHVVARELFDRRSDRLLNDWRRRCGVEVVPSRQGLLPVMKALRGGGIVGALVDQDTRGPAVFAPFFGRMARTSRAPFVIGRRTGTPLVPMWTHRRPDGGHRVVIRPEIEPSRRPDSEAALVADVTRWNGLFEQAIRRHPAEWVWHHRRWKSSPPATTESVDLREFSTEASYLESYQRSRETAGAR